MGQYDDEIEIFWASELAFIRSVVYRELRGFDDDFAHQEEIDLCWRAINKGYSIKYNYKSTVYHVGGATLQQGNRRKHFKLQKFIINVNQNVPKDNLYRILFSRMILDGIAGLQFLCREIFSFLQFLKHTILLQAVFKDIQKNFQKIKYYNIKSIVYQYYINSGKIFTR
jgi:GT2 family glycosyltransferase